ncbi:hypothetical protein TrVE_jg9577 [Triparma verrucosa]|uniref:SRCR domain-containing protein n=1 Tax=Triparma verrucosa TaxID=1606542 RepID=A0A9W7EXA0_9STRA|nr:hypothetical protein TrVE_jg9577 [Triparma verrucosa]
MWAAAAFLLAACMGADARRLAETYTIVMRDSHGDGWHGGTLNLTDVHSGNVVASFTGPQESCKYNPPLDTCESIETVSLDCGNFEAAQHGSTYHEECSWEIRDAAGLIMASASGTSAASFANNLCASCGLGHGSIYVSGPDCEVCPAGKYSDVDGAGSCKICEAGKYGSTPSAVACVACEAGKASSTAGASACTACSGELTSNDDRTLCGCGLGSGNSFPSGQLQDASSVRIRDTSNNSPTFDSEGVASGRIEVKPSGETAWGTIDGNSNWDSRDALVACREIGNELGYATVSGTPLGRDDTADGSGEIWWESVQCSGSEGTLESCSKWTTSSTSHHNDIGITCKYIQADECEACPAGKFSDTIDTSSCTNCEAGHYSSTRSATSADTCLTCEEGKAAIAGSSNCIASSDGGGGEEEEEGGEVDDGSFNEAEEIDRGGAYWKFINATNPVIIAAVSSTAGLVLALYVILIIVVAEGNLGFWTTLRCMKLSWVGGR